MRGLLIASALLLLLAPAAHAHSLLLGSSPDAGAVIAQPPSRITLLFNNRVEKSLSKVRVLDAAGRLHDLPLVAGEGAANTLAVTVPPLDPGPYRVEWQVLSTDGHVVSGFFSFRLQP